MTDSTTLCPCGREISRQSHDSGKDWAWKVANQRCRRKCLRLFPADKDRPRPSLPSAVKWVEGESRAVPKVETWRSEEYKAWVRSLPCLHCGAVEGVAAHHENEVGKGGKGIKTDDSRCVPLCHKHHTFRHSIGRTVWSLWRIDIEAVILQLCEEWQRQQSFKARGKI